MPSACLVTETARQDIINKTNAAQAGVDQYNTNTAIFQQTFLQTLNLHKAKKWEAHGASVLAATYIDGGMDTVATIVMQIATTAGTLYVPCRPIGA